MDRVLRAARRGAGRAARACSAQHAKDDFAARLRLLRIAARRRKGASTALLQHFLTDPDERLVRMAAREIVRRRPADLENMLLQLMTTAGDSVRRVISRAIGQAGFEHFWNRFDRLPKATRKQAGRAMLKILPDAVAAPPAPAGDRAGRAAAQGDADDRRAGPRPRRCARRSLQLCSDPNPKLRSKAVVLVGQLPDMTPDMLVERLLNDADARVRANTIEVLEARNDPQFLPVLAERARASNNRERANAIKALNRMKVGAASSQLAQHAAATSGPSTGSRRCGRCGRSAGGSCSARSAGSPRTTATSGPPLRAGRPAQRRRAGHGSSRRRRRR